MRRCAILLLFTACGTSERPDPLPLDVEATLVGSATVSIDALRLAVAHRTEDALVITTDVAVTATGTPVLVTLDPPPIDEPIPTGIVFILERSLTVQVPAFAAYLDVDGSESLDPSVDRVLGISADAMIQILDLDEQLAALPPEHTAEYYRQTRDRYTPFLHAMRLNDQYYAPSAPEPILVDITEAALAGTELACGIQRIGVVEGATEVHLAIDAALDLGPLCEVGVGSCESVDVSSLEPIEPTTDPADSFEAVRAQCSRRGSLVAFVVEERGLRCDASLCECTRTTSVESVITSTSALPPWWPCGDRIDYCDANGPLYLIDPACPDGEDVGT